MAAMGEELDEKPNGPIFYDVRRYYCEFCGICRSKKSLITSHVLAHHQEEVEKRREIDEEGDTTEDHKSTKTCEECGATFKKPAHLKQHMLSHSFEIMNLCGSV